MEYVRRSKDKRADRVSVWMDQESIDDSLVQWYMVQCGKGEKPKVRKASYKQRPKRTKRQKKASQRTAAKEKDGESKQQGP